MPPALSPSKARTQPSILNFFKPRSSPMRSTVATSSDRPQSSTKRSLNASSQMSSQSVARKQHNGDDDEDDESMQEVLEEKKEDGSEVSEDEDENLTPATSPRRSQRSPTLSASRQTTRKYAEEEEEGDSDKDDNDDEIMLDAKDTGDEVEQEMALTESGVYPVGTVITKQFDEGCFTGEIISHALVDDETYHLVLYEDGDREDLSRSEIKEVLMAAEKRNATKEPAKKRLKMAAKAPRKKAAKAKAQPKKPAAVEKRKLTPPRKARDAKKAVACLEDSESEVEWDSSSNSNNNKNQAAVQNRRRSPRKVGHPKRTAISLEESDSEVEVGSDKKLAAIKGRKVRNDKQHAARLEESDSDAETESDVGNMDSDSVEAPPPKKKRSVAAKPKVARAPPKKKFAATSKSKRAESEDDEDLLEAPPKKKQSAAAKPKAARVTAPAKKKGAATSTSDTRNVLKVPYSGGDGLEIIVDPQAMFDDMIDTKLTDNGENSEILIPLVKALKNRRLRVATMCSGTESPILALDMLQKSIRKHCSAHLSREMDELGINVESLFQIEHVFSCEIEPFKQAYIERNFHPPLLFRDIRELGDDKAHTAYGGLVDVPNTPGCVDILIAGTSCVDYSNLNNRKVSELVGGIK
jgi:hypothetical protein